MSDYKMENEIEVGFRAALKGTELSFPVDDYLELGKALVRNEVEEALKHPQVTSEDSTAAREKVSDAMAHLHAGVFGMSVTQSLQDALDAYHACGKPRAFNGFVQGFFAALVVIHPGYPAAVLLGEAA